MSEEIDVVSMSDYRLAQLRNTVEAETNHRYEMRTKAVEAKLERGERFDDEELVYAAHRRCKCGAGMAYPKGASMHCGWECSALLTWRARRPGEAGAVDHTDKLKFATHEITSERHRIAAGATTRPAKGG